MLINLIWILLNLFIYFALENWNKNKKSKEVKKNMFKNNKKIMK
jgi:hypothetical protein